MRLFYFDRLFPFICVSCLYSPVFVYISYVCDHLSPLQCASPLLNCLCLPLVNTPPLFSRSLPDRLVPLCLWFLYPSSCSQSVIIIQCVYDLCLLPDHVSCLLSFDTPALCLWITAWFVTACLPARTFACGAFVQ